jgi:hypothetical protein
MLVSLMLGDTRARAVVNGFVSPPARFQAGVRQGCPLAPLLYLFAGEAMLRFFQARGLGILLAGQRVVAGQFADDTQAPLAGAHQMPLLRGALDTYASASRQVINLSKCRALPIGAVAAVPLAGARVGGVQLVAEATALGVTFAAGTGDAQPKGGWEAAGAKVLGAFERLAHLPLSRFGRAFGSAAYGLGRILFAAEFCGLPPQPLLDQLQRAAAKLIDRKQAPGDSRRRFAGVRADLLAGRPVDGGFGALPLVEHVCARWAVWGSRMLAGQHDGVWVAVARALLQRQWGEPDWHPMVPLASGERARPGGLGDFFPLPGPLARLVAALRALPPAGDVAGEPLQLGPLAAHVPLWGNPLLPWRGGGEEDELCGLETPFLDFYDAGLRSVGDVWRVAAALAACPRAPWQPSYVAHVWAPLLRRTMHLPTRERLEDRLPLLLAALPAQWRSARAAGAGAAAPAVGTTLAQAAEAADALLPRLGWRLPEGGRSVRLAALSVSQVAALLLAPVSAERRGRHGRVAAAACGVAPGGAPPAEALDAVGVALRGVWRLRWSNERKELYWRLLVDGLPTAARMHLEGEAGACPCGHAGPVGWQHHFWECPAARRVASAVGARLPAGTPLTRRHLWLMCAPPGVRVDAWRVVALCALQGMWRARGVLVAPRLAGGAAAPMPPGLVERAGAAGVAHFWDLLEEFARVGRPPQSWRRLLGAAHPFLRFPRPAGGLEVLRA